MQLDCYKIHDYVPEIVPSRASRDWMDAIPGRHPYRCLPLTIANASGWTALCPVDVTIEWNGGPASEDLEFYTEGDPRQLKGFIDSHFRHGIVTFHLGYIFRTPPGWRMWVSGAPNQIKPGISPLTGLVETDWLPFPFTMNWRMTQPGRVTFEKAEPFCFLMPTEHMRLDTIQPVIHSLKDNPDLQAEYEAWNASRADFNARLAVN